MFRYTPEVDAQIVLTQYCAGVGGTAAAVSNASRSYLCGRRNSTDDDARITFGAYGTDCALNRLIKLRENY